MPPIDQGAEPDDLRGMLETAFADEGSNADEGSSSTGAETIRSDGPEAGSDRQEVSGTEDRARGPDGKFIPKTEQKAAPLAAAASELPSKDATAKVSTEPASTPADAPPAGWTAEGKVEWTKLSPAVKAAVIKRETEISNGGRQWSDEKRRYEAVLSPVVQSASRRGLSTEEGIQRLMNAQDHLDRDPRGAIAWLAKSYGVDLATLAGNVSASDASRETPPTLPNIEALVRQAVNPILAPIQERWQAEQQRQQESVVSFVTNFATSPGHEHFDAVESELKALIPHIQAANPGMTHDKVLQEAYDRAVYANPSTRKAVMDAQAVAAEEKRRAEAQSHAKNARLAASSVTGSRSGSQSTEPKGSLREEIEAAFAGG